MESKGKDLLIGIDLGTSRTSIMTDRGMKTMIDSVVGYPKDLIGVKLLGATHVVGSEALERHYLNHYFPLEDGVIKETGDRDQEVAKELIRHVVSLADPQPGDRVCGIVGVPARASAFNKDVLLELARDVMDVAMVISEPFMVAYGQDVLLNSIVIDIGAGTVDLCALKGKVPDDEDQVTLIKAGNFIDNLLMESIQMRYPNVQINLRIARAIKEQYAFVGKAEEAVMVTMRENGKPVTVDVTEELELACNAVIPDIVEQIEHLVTGFDPEDQETVLANIIVAGGGSRIRNLNKVISESLTEYGTVVVNCVEGADYAGCLGGLKLASDLPPDYWDHVGEMVTA
ncbi:MAG: hypothetical protein HON68_09765 [Gammaproteobacteria bacterium]|jgi:rod shape-determining protein MreB|nr:hypothetical protein [Gammaproteobacteria bacterium]MBT3488888.1 hypothetical protein [Gammaproteobacteria bacterium]MBT3718550.1 hypothetical protein [Gammaproteobacteria bacterium]MBT3844480.1 hypothetical protein [Gammaproteobacteria bacterium]MBT3891934.1 hypothetical protein [Gammaproteobacteria bacterium]